VLRCGGWEVVEFDGPVLELMSDARTRSDLRLAALGQDGLGERFDAGAFLARLREDDPGRTIGEALLRQRTVAGIGNVWKSECCFAVGVDPWRTLAQLSDEQALALVGFAREHVRASAREGFSAAAARGVPARGGRACAAALRSARADRARATARPTGARPASAEHRAHTSPRARGGRSHQRGELAPGARQRAAAARLQDQLQVEDARVEAPQRVLGGNRVRRHATLASPGGDLEGGAAGQRALVQVLRAHDHRACHVHARVETQRVEQRAHIALVPLRERHGADVGLGQPAFLDAAGDRVGDLRGVQPGAERLASEQQRVRHQHARVVDARRHDRASFQSFILFAEALCAPIPIEVRA
jgi:hypothetical protein